jgi:hypothetical protein
MSIIQQERDNIINNDNTAQLVLQDFIKDLNADITELNIQSSLHGDLDLSILKDKFKKIQSLSFGKGKITTINNVPDGVYKLICSNNLLLNLEDLPGSLLYLDIDGNFFESFDFVKTPHLEELHCSHNKLEKFQNIPESLTILFCDYNELKHLDFKNLPNLRILHCSHNPLLAVENIPETIHEFVADKTPYSMETTIDYDIDDDDDDDDDKNKEKNDKKGGERNKKISYMDALNIYFKLKSKYDKQLLETKRKKYKEMYVKTASKMSGARAAFSEKGTCINCKRKVGSKFYTNKEGYFAICGDKQNPCKLDIKLFRGNFFVNEYYMYLYKEQMETEKEAIIKHKLDTLFGHISEEQSVRLFKTKLESFNLISELYNEVVKRDNELHNNIQKRNDVKNKQKEVYEISDKIQTILNEYYADSTNKEILQTAVNIHIRDLLPEIDNLRRLKYNTVEMVDDTLIQREVNISKLEFTYGEPPKVERFRGV